MNSLSESFIVALSNLKANVESSIHDLSSQLPSVGYALRTLTIGIDHLAQSIDLDCTGRLLSGSFAEATAYNAVMRTLGQPEVDFNWDSVTRGLKVSDLVELVEFNYPLTPSLKSVSGTLELGAWTLQWNASVDHCTNRRRGSVCVSWVQWPTLFPTLIVTDLHHSGVKELILGEAVKMWGMELNPLPPKHDIVALAYQQSYRPGDLEVAIKAANGSSFGEEQCVIQGCKSIHIGRTGGRQDKGSSIFHSIESKHVQRVVELLTEVFDLVEDVNDPGWFSSREEGTVPPRNVALLVSDSPADPALPSVGWWMLEFVGGQYELADTPENLRKLLMERLSR